MNLNPKHRQYISIGVCALSGLSLLNLLSMLGLSMFQSIFGGITLGTIVGVLDLVVAYWIYKRQL